MDDRDVYGIDFDLGPADKAIDGFIDRLTAAEQRIVAIFKGIEEAAVGSTGKAAAELGRLTGAIEASLDKIEKKVGRRKKPIVIVEQKDVDAAKQNLDAMGDAVEDLAKKVGEETAKMADDVGAAFGSGDSPKQAPRGAGFFANVRIIDDTPGDRPPSSAPPDPAAAAASPFPPAATPSKATEDALKKQAAAAEQAERAFIRLLAAELKTAAGADTITRDYIQSAAAVAKNSEAFLDQINAVAKVRQEEGLLSKEQVGYAVKVATIRAEIEKLNRALHEQAAAYDAAQKKAKEDLGSGVADGSLGGESQSVDTLVDEADARQAIIKQIELQVDQLRLLDAQQEKGAALLQEEADRRAALAAETKKGIQDAAAARVAAARQEKASLAAETAAQNAAQKAEREALQRKIALQKQSAAEFVRIARVMGTETTALNALVQKYGGFEAVLRKSGQASNELEKELQDIIQQSPLLKREFDRLTGGIEEFTLKANPATFRSAQGFGLDPNDVRQLGFAFQRFGVTGVAAFGEIYAAIGPVGIAVGIVTLGVVGLTKALIAVGKAGVEAFKAILEESIKLSRARETTLAGFEAYLGDAEAAATAIKEIDRISKELGTDVSPVAQSFLPQVSSIEELELLAEVAQSLKLSKPGKEITDTVNALREFQAGDITSLRKQFEVPSYVLDDMKKAVERTGNWVDGIDLLRKYLTDTGRSSEALGDTFDVSANRAQEFFSTLGRDLGLDIVSSLERQLNEALSLVSDKESLLRGFAYGVGEVISGVIERIGSLVTTLIESLDEESLGAALDRVQRLGQSISILVEALGALTGTGGEFSLVADSLGYIAGEVERVGLVVATIVNLFVAWTEGAELLLAHFRVAVTGAMQLISGGDSAQFDAAQAYLDSVEKRTAQSMARFREINDLMNALNADTPYFVARNGGSPEDGFDQGIQDYIRSLEEGDTDELNAILAAKREEAMDELSEEVTKYLESIQDLRQEITDKNIDLAIKLSDDIADFLEENARKRVEIAQKLVDKLIDLEEEYNRKVRDANVDLADKLEDVDIEAGRARIRQAQDFADKRLKIEEDYQRKIAEIRRKYAFDLEEAARQNDAIAYLRLLRQRDFDLNEARIDRDESLEDVDDDEGRKAAEAARKRKEDEEDALRSHKRKLRDLNQWLDDQEADIQKDYKREIEAQTLHEEQKRDDMMKNYKRSLRDLELHYEQKLKQINEDYAKEYNLIEAWETRIAEMTARIRATTGFTGKGSPTGKNGGAIGETGAQAGTGTGTTTPGTTTGGSSGGSTQAQHSEAWYRVAVTQMARQLGYTHLLPLIPTWGLTQLIAAYNNMLRVITQSGQTPTVRDSGGHVQANQPTIVGANGQKELFIPATAGYIQPLADMYRQPSYAAAPAINRVDNRKIQVDLTLLDTAMLDRSTRELVKVEIMQTMKEAFDGV